MLASGRWPSCVAFRKDKCSRWISRNLSKQCQRLDIASAGGWAEDSKFADMRGDVKLKIAWSPQTAG